jgi:hypothetical protein
LTRNADESIARELRPSKDDQVKINEILKQPDFLYLKDEDKFHLWRYRYTLKHMPSALVKFL